MDFSEKSIIKDYVYNGRFISVREDKVELPDKKITTKFVVEHPGAVAILPVDDEGKIIFVRQYRYAVGEVTLEIPAGRIEESDMSKEDAAVRELREEIGFEPGEIKSLGKLFPSPGFLGEIIHLYIAKNLSKNPLEQDPDEFIEIERYTIDEAVEMVMSGEIADAKTQIAVLKAKDILK